MTELIPWELPRPEPTTGTVSGTAFYSDGVTPVPNVTVQTVRIDSGVATDRQFESGKFLIEETGGDYTLNIIFNGSIIGNVNITIVNGQEIVQDVVTNRGLV